MLLADAAQVADGKLFILGGGWDVCGPGRTPMALAFKVEIPPSQARRTHNWSIVLLDGNGEPALFSASDGQKSAVVLQGQFERTSDSASPDELDHLTFAVNIAPLPLQPGSHYVWQFSIDNKTRKDWQVPFRTRPATPPPS